MFDIGWSEILVILVVMLFAFGPEDIPKIMYNLGRVMRRFRYMRYALSSQFESFMEQAENQSKPAKKDGEKPQAVEVMDDESDADEHLLDLMPVPDALPADKPAIDDNERTNVPSSAADRG